MKHRSSIDRCTVRRLLAGGCPMPSEHPDKPQPDLRIEVSRPEVTVAYDMRAGTEYVFAVRITNCSHARLKIEQYRARFGWAANLYWLGDPRVYSPERNAYRLESGREFSCRDVLNHRLGDQGLIEPGKSVEGILLAYTMFERIPFDYIHGCEAPARLSVADQYGRRHSSLIEFSIDRRATMRPLVPRPRGMGLFDVPELKTRPIVTGGMRSPAPDPTVREVV